MCSLGKNVFAIVVFFTGGAFAAAPDFRGRLYSEVASAYLSSSGSLSDTHPVTVQQADWLFDFYDFGKVSGYFWTISSLHDKQGKSHRMAFNQFETALYYGYDWTIRPGVALKTKTGPLWNPQIGYDHGHNCDWGWHYVQRLETKWVVPYVNALWMFSPYSRARIRMGLERSFVLGEAWTLTPSVETVWMDRERYRSRYGGAPDTSVFGGAFACVVTGLKVTWRFNENWRFFARIRQYDVINNQSRRAIKRQDNYWSKCDYPIVGIGVECNF